LLVSAYNRAKYDLREHDFKDIIIHASLHEFRPILMMLFVAIIGLIPAARSAGIGSDVQRPLATVIIGGLTTTLLLTPFVIPPLYYLLGRKKWNKWHTEQEQKSRQEVEEEGLEL
jgi:cobalt-zinc-cadmium resistance protein CzcA